MKLITHNRSEFTQQFNTTTSMGRFKARRRSMIRKRFLIGSRPAGREPGTLSLLKSCRSPRGLPSLLENQSGGLEGTGNQKGGVNSSTAFISSLPAALSTRCWR